VSGIFNKTDCLNQGPPYRWVNRKYNFDNLGQVLRSHIQRLYTVPQPSPQRLQRVFTVLDFETS